MLDSQLLVGDEENIPSKVDKQVKTEQKDPLEIWSAEDCANRSMEQLPEFAENEKITVFGGGAT